MPRIITKDNLINKLGWKEECAICKLTEWMGEPIKLKINHINGFANVNRIDNIRLLCYNCHSQARMEARNINKRIKKFERSVKEES